MMPSVGDAVAGASYTPHDGHVSPLYLLRALHEGFLARGGRYLPSRPVDRIGHSDSSFQVRAAGELHRAGKVILTAGLSNRELGEQIGLNIPVAPLKGQILVTERARMTFNMPTTFVRQTEEGSFLLGDSHEDAGFSVETTTAIMREIAGRAIRSFPFLKSLRVVRGWGCLRTMTPDSFPVYDESDSHPGAFAVSCHSGVTLAAQHALKLAPLIAEGGFRKAVGVFSAKRFSNAAA
jgi:glycine/D-amino acid oxidase-like deaminating enzyme